MSSRRYSIRPRGVAALACLFAFATLASGIALMALVTPGGSLDSIWRINPRGHDVLVRMGVWAFPLLGSVCLAFAVTAFGLLGSKPWGYRAALIMLALNLTGNLVDFLSGNELRAAIGVPIVAIFIWYLTISRVRRYFFPPRDPIRLDVRPR